jgi:hypothetical protein
MQEDFHLLDNDWNVIVADEKDAQGRDEQGGLIKRPVIAGPPLLWRFSILVLRNLKLLPRPLSSNNVERVFSLVALGFHGGGINVGHQSISRLAADSQAWKQLGIQIS